MARRVASDLVAYGHVRRPRLGVGIHDVTEVDAEVYGLEDIAGAEVVYVEENSAAAEAGVRIGDVVTQLDGEAVRNATALTARLALFQPGQEIALTVIRSGEARRLTARLGEFPPRQEPQPAAGAPAPAEHRLGFDLAPLSPAVARELEREATDTRFRAPESGVYVANVARGTAAALAGLRSRQVLVSINGHEVSSATEAEAIIAGLAPGEAVSARVLDPHLGEMVANFRVR
jgi:serine protease Do